MKSKSAQIEGSTVRKSRWENVTDKIQKERKSWPSCQVECFIWHDLTASSGFHVGNPLQVIMTMQGEDVGMLGVEVAGMCQRRVYFEGIVKKIDCVWSMRLGDESQLTGVSVGAWGGDLFGGQFPFTNLEISMEAN